ncbi:cation transporter [Maricaulis sp. W15]|uniref:cation diffusion facilitator family transporter n=1 Tax=Maricaulis sp. W15 TaxID=1772333 RepID=UPI000948A0E6|nr:cation diffusion facilitator family transporter [Maricaulis sp. W15]OLF71385.1 cation transporter [Maricaulis sp. W15]
MPHDFAAGPGGPGRLSPKDALSHTGQATAASVVVALILTLTKAGVWWMSGSVALLASMADSLLDLTASLAVYLSVRYAAEPADAEHRFGHGKAEAFAGILQAIFVAMSAVLLLREGVEHLFNPVEIRAGGWALGVMVLSIVLTVGLLVIQTRAVRETGSVAVEGDRAHYFSDLGANGVVIIGILGATLGGWFWLDGLAALAVSGWLFWTAWGVARSAADQLMDRELPDEARDHIAALARDDLRIIDIHQLRTRAAGPLVHIQFHMALDPGLSLREAHTILIECERRLLAAYPAADIIIHADPHGEAEPHGGEFFNTETTSKDA